MLTSTLSVAPVEEGFEFTLTVTNEGPDPVELSFRSGQRFDFVVEEKPAESREGSGEGEKKVRWRYSDGRMFTQALESETLEPGESQSYEAVWSDPPAGEYEVRGTSTAENVDVDAEMSISIPE